MSFTLGWFCLLSLGVRIPPRSHSKVKELSPTQFSCFLFDILPPVNNSKCVLSAFPSAVRLNSSLPLTVLCYAPSGLPIPCDPVWASALHLNCTHASTGLVHLLSTASAHVTPAACSATAQYASLPALGNYSCGVVHAGQPIGPHFDVLVRTGLT